MTPRRSLSVVAGGLVLAVTSFAQCTLSKAVQWDGSISSAWMTGANWSSGTAPNNASTSVCITNPANNPVTTAGIEPSIASLQIGSGNSLTIAGATNLTVNGGSLLNAGAIALNSSLELGANTTLSGGGTLTLSNTATAFVFGNPGGLTLTNVDNTISGAGNVGMGGMILNNEGTINGNVALTVQAFSGSTNSGTLEATAGGRLTISGGAWTNSATLQAASGGTLEIDSTIGGAGNILSTGAGSNVYLPSAATINGGMLATANGGAITVSGATLNGITIASGSSVTVTSQPSEYTLLSAGTIANNGNLIVNPSGSNPAGLNLLGNVTLAGSGALTLNSSTGATIVAQNNSATTLTNQQTIQGAGTIESTGVISDVLALNNQGIVNANQGNPLTLFAVNIANSGTLEASSGGTLTLQGGTIANTGNGTILSTGAGSTVNLFGQEMNGGTLTTANGGVINISGQYLNGITISTGSSVTVTGTPANLTGLPPGTLTNNGVLTVNSLAGLQLLGNVTLAGSGTLKLNASSNNTIIAQSASTFTNQETIQGMGNIGGANLSLNNQGTIDANLPGPFSVPLILNPASVANTGTLEATAGGTLEIESGTVTNTLGGNILSTGASSTVNLFGETINGGTLATGNGGALNISGATLNGITISTGSSVNVTAKQATYTSLSPGTINNNGALAVNTGASLSLLGDVTLAGSGSLTLNSGSIVAQTAPTTTLTNQQTIEGAGIIEGGGTFNVLIVNNQGAVNANQSNPLTLGIATVANTGTLEATSGGTLTLEGDTITNTGAGSILSTGTGSAVHLYGTTINGGTLATANGGYMDISVATLNGITIAAGSSVTVNDTVTGNTRVQAGTITNNGVLTVDSLAPLNLVGNVTLAGSGILNLNDFSNSTISAVISSTLTNQSTIQGMGAIGGANLSLNNQGTINANQSGQFTVPLILNTASIVNTGTLEATGGGTLEIEGGSVATQSNGSILSTGAGSTVNLLGTLVNGGTLATSNGGVINLSGSTLTGLTVATGSSVNVNNMQASTTQVLAGTLTNNGGIAINPSANQTANLFLLGNVTLAGTGTLTLNNATNALIQVQTNSTTLTNQETIQGAGQIAGNLINNGTLLANQSGALTVTALTNNGTIQVNADSTLFATGPAGSFSNFINGGLIGGTYDVSGTLQIDALGSTGGEIAANGATILLDGAAAHLLDSKGMNALSELSGNFADGIFTVADGQDFDTLSSFGNEGILAIGSGSTFASEFLIQRGGTTIADGVLQTSAEIIGGTLSGDGTVTGSLSVDQGGAVDPVGFFGTPGTLTVDGVYDQGANGTLDIDIGGTAAGTQYAILNILAGAVLDGTLAITSVDGFTPAAGDSFVVMDFAANKGTEFSSVTWANLANDLTYSVDYESNSVVIDVSEAPTPEPGTWGLLVGGLAALLAGAKRSRRGAFMEREKEHI